MKKQVTYLELLQMVKDGKQPNEVKHQGRKYEWKNGTYSRQYNNVREYMSIVSKSTTEVSMAEDKVYEYEEEILDEKEKEYLKSVIKPFRNRVKTIERIKNKEWERIVVFYKDYDDTRDHVRSYMSLPMFEVGTMYKGMEQGKEYTLEDLGL